MDRFDAVFAVCFHASMRDLRCVGPDLPEAFVDLAFEQAEATAKTAREAAKRFEERQAAQREEKTDG